MALEVLKCTGCGAHLPPPANVRYITCGFCKESMVNPGYVPESMPTAVSAPPVAPAQGPLAAQSPPAAPAPAAPAAPGAPATAATQAAPAAPAAAAPASVAREVPRSPGEWASVARGILQLHGSLFYAPGIPAAKEHNARTAYGAALPAAEPILVLYDATVFGAGDDGFVITPAMLGWNDGTARVVPWRDIDPATVKVAEGHVTVLRDKIALVPDDLQEPLARLIREMAGLSRTAPAPAPAPAVAPAPPPGPSPAPAAAIPAVVTEWFAVVNGDQKGSLSLDHLRQMITQGIIDAGTFVWREGMAEWQPMKAVAELSALLSAAPAPSRVDPAPAAAHGPGHGPGHGAPAHAAPAPVHAPPAHVAPGHVAAAKIPEKPAPQAFAVSKAKIGSHVVEEQAEEDDDEDDPAANDEAVLEMIHRFLKAHDAFHIAPGIPTHAEKTARHTHRAALPHDERILALFSGDGGGFLITSERLCWLDGDGEPQTVEWEELDIDDVSIEDGELYIGEEGVDTGEGAHHLGRHLKKVIEAVCAWAQD